MSVVRPFAAIRPSKEHAKNVISLPYDVMNRAEAKAMAADNPNSFLHISRSEIDLPDDINQYSEEVYEKAKSNLKDFRATGVFIQEDSPAFYIYRQIMGDNCQTGIVGTVSIDEYEDNTIKKHELTRVEKEKDRINHFDVCNGNTEPIFLTYKNQEDESVKETISKWIDTHQPEYDIQTDDGIRHILWVVDDESIIEKIEESFKDIKNLYIADGHHRSASGYKVGKKRREENKEYTGDEEFNYFMAVIFPDSDLNIYDYNRTVKDLNGLEEQEFLKRIEDDFAVEVLGKEAVAPDKKHVFTMYLNGVWYKLTAKDGTFDSDDPIKSLDVSILQDNLLNPVLGIEDPRTDNRIDFVGGIRGLGELEKRADGDMAVSFAVYPVSISDLLDVADADMIMPPKSTWFEPKLGSGLFVHEL